MAYGLQVFDSSGNLTLDLSSRISRLFGLYTYASFTTPNAVNVTVPGISNDGTWYAYVADPTLSCIIYAGYVNISRQMNSGVYSTNIPVTTYPASSLIVWRA